MNAIIFPLRSGKSYLVQVSEYLRSEDRWVVRAVRKFTNPREADESFRESRRTPSVNQIRRIARRVESN